MGRYAARYLLPYIGSVAIEAITPATVLELLRKTEKFGPTSQHKAVEMCSAVIKYAVITGRAESDPCRDIKDALPPIRREHFPGITEPKRVGELLRKIAELENMKIHPVCLAALKLMPYTFVRSQELRGARWSEIDFSDSTWRIASDRMKMKKQHTVPLATQCLTILKDIRALNIHEDFIFPGPQRPSKCLSETTMLWWLRRTGFTGAEMTIHGFRTTASTLLNELGFRPDIIEIQLAHREQNAVRDAYNRAAYLKERREMMQAWADYLDKLRDTGN
jgi:integrase